MPSATPASNKKARAKSDRAKTPEPTASGFLPSGSPSLVAVIRESLGLTREVFSRLTGFSTRAIAGWEKGEPVSEPAVRRMRELKRFRDRLSQVVDAASIPRWLLEPNQAFDGLKPIEVIERGEIDRLWDMIFYLDSGIAG
jgi:DNA-binding transcriptional regulator YiaG